MSAPAAIEVIVMSAITSETKASGQVRKVTFLLPNDGPHPFAGMVGDRLHIVPVRINDDETPRAAPVGEEPVSRTSPTDKPKKEWADLPPSQQAALRCNDWEFRQHIGVTTLGEAADFVRRSCGVASRADLDRDLRARILWHQTDREFMEATGRVAIAR